MVAQPPLQATQTSVTFKGLLMATKTSAASTIDGVKSKFNEELLLLCITVGLTWLQFWRYCSCQLYEEDFCINMHLPWNLKPPCPPCRLSTWRWVAWGS